MAKDIKAEAAEIVKRLKAKARRCRVCVLSKKHPHEWAVFLELLAQGVSIPKASRWWFDEIGGGGFRWGSGSCAWICFAAASVGGGFARRWWFSVDAGRYLDLYPAR